MRRWYSFRVWRRWTLKLFWYFGWYNRDYCCFQLKSRQTLQKLNSSVKTRKILCILAIHMSAVMRKMSDIITWQHKILKPCLFSWFASFCKALRFWIFGSTLRLGRKKLRRENSVPNGSCDWLSKFFKPWKLSSTEWPDSVLPKPHQADNLQLKWLWTWNLPTKIDASGQFSESQALLFFCSAKQWIKHIFLSLAKHYRAATKMFKEY